MGNRIMYNEDRKIAQDIGLLHNDECNRRCFGDHHPNTKRLFKFIQAHDENEYRNYFDWRSGGDGDNGEILMAQMDAFFEMIEVNGNNL